MGNALASRTPRVPATSAPPVWGSISLLFRPVDIAWLVFFRVLFGLVMLWEVCRYFANDWIRKLYLNPQIHFTYDGFHWVRPWPGAWLYVHFIGLGLLALFITLGLFYRASAALFLLGFTYVFLLDKAYYLNHFYLIILLAFLMIFLPAHRALSIDAWRKPELWSQTVPAWTLWLLRIQIGLVYFFAGVAKLNSDWLRGEPMRLWLARRAERFSLGHLLTEEWVVYCFTYGGLLLDLLAFPALLFRRTRIAAILLLAMFHLMNAGLFHIGVFPWLMLGASMIYLDPSWPRRLLGVPARAGPAGSDGHSHAAHGHFASPLRRRIVVAGMASWLLVQCLLPLRHLLCPGDVLWTEEGHRFSWRMKLRDKQGKANFFAVDPDTRERRPISLQGRLTRRQSNRVAVLPDLLRQMARQLAEEQRTLHGKPMMICVESAVSLNGRRAQPLVDPNLDLGSVHAPPLAHWPWITPLTEPLRPPMQAVHDAPDDFGAEN